MTRLLVVGPEAESDLADAQRWYASEQPGLGRQFRQEVREAIGRIRESPFAYARVYGEIRRAFIRRFPYTLYFVLNGERIVILAVIHMHDPAILGPRLA